MRLQATNITAGYGKQAVLENISLSAEAGTITALLGMNGSGKSTLLRVLAALLPKQSGQITVDGHDLTALPHSRRMKLISFMPQETEAVNLTSYEAVLTGLRACGMRKRKKEETEHIERYLETFRLQHLALKPARELSGGEFQRVLLAKTLAQEPRILLLDEPTSHLDIAHQLEVLHLLKDMTRERGLTTILVTHNINNAFRFCGRFAFLRSGRLEAWGGRDVISRRLLQRTFSIDATIETLHNRTFVVPLKASSITD